MSDGDTFTTITVRKSTVWKLRDIRKLDKNLPRGVETYESLILEALDLLEKKRAEEER